MIAPDKLDAATLEWALELIEKPSPLDFIGTGSRRKRDREDAALRMRVREEQRGEIAARIRRVAASGAFDPADLLLRIARQIERGESGAVLLPRAWPLAWRGWLTITAQIHCASNSLPPLAEYRVEITDRGREVLAAADAADAR